MNETIERFGALLGKQTGRHPGLVRGTLSAVYRTVGFQASHFPNTRTCTPAREYMQGFTGNLLSRILAHPRDAVVVNIFMSCEIFHVLGLTVSAPEALALFAANTAIEQPFIEAAQENGAPETLCSFHQTLLGLAETNVLKAPRMIANTTLACDANQLTFRRLAEIWKVPHFVVDVPFEISEDAVSYVADQLMEMQTLAETCCHKKVSLTALKAAVARSIRTQEQYRKYLSLRPHVHLPEIMTPELLSVISNHLYLGLDQAEKYARMLVSDAESASSSTGSPKILWMHVLPNAQESMKAFFQGVSDSPFEVLGCDLAYDNLVPMDPEKPYESMARRMVYSSYNGPGSRRIERTIQMAREMKADGVLVYCQWGCKQTQGIAFTAKKELEEAGFPTLVLDGDACDRTNEASGQSSTRVSAYLEELQAAIKNRKERDSVYGSSS